MKALPPTCTGPSISLTQFARAFSAAGDPNLPDWPLPPGRLILTHSARGAIALACNAWNLGPGDEALAPAYNCGCEIDALLAASLHVRFYRVDRHAQPDWDDCRRRVTGRTRLILVTHTFGRPLGLNDLGTWCRANGLRLLEDCAHALFSSHTNPPEAGRPHWEPVGGLGDAAIFSLPKTLPIPDGGILVFRSGAHISPPNVGELRRADVATVWREALPLLKTTWSSARLCSGPVIVFSAKAAKTTEPPAPMIFPTCPPRITLIRPFAAAECRQFLLVWPRPANRPKLSNVAARITTGS